MLMDAQNRDFYVISVEYMQLLRIFTPSMTTCTHSGRISDLMTFYFWLSQRKVRSLTTVTRDHIDLYSETIAYGKEWALQAPHLLVRYLKHCYENGEELPKEKYYKNRISRSKIYHAAGIRRPLVCLNICSHIIRRIEKIGLSEELTFPIREIVKLCGYTLKPNTVTYINRTLLPIEELWEWKHQFSGPTLTFNPYPRSASKVAERLGRPTGRSRTIPPQVAIVCMSEAMKWVIELSPIIIRGLDQNWDCLELTDSLLKAGLLITVNDKGRRGINFKKGQVDRDGLIRLLGAACFIVIASLSARRLGEILELGVGRCKQDSRGNYWLKTYIEKTSRQYDEIPVTNAVYEAIMCMESLSANARQETKRDCIWQFRQFCDGEIRDLRPGKYLNHFRQICPSLSGTEWRFTAHQFRRFFSILYFWWYEKGDVVALSHHLRHFDLEMTRRYVTDIEFGRLWKDVQNEWQAKFVRDVVYGTRSVGGKAGHRLNQLIDKLRQQFRKEVDVLKIDRIVDRVLKLAHKLGVPFKQHVWGTVCACPRKTSFAKYANCKGSAATGPDFGNAAEELCGSCPFAIQTSAYIASAKSALTDRRNLTSGLSQDSLIYKFTASSCTNLEKIIEKGEPFPL